MTNPWPRAIIHVDGDAFFASVYQAMHPTTKGKPLVIGWERGIATAISYEAKKWGIKRGMMIHEIKQLCPQCLVVSSDYRLYELFSQRMMTIIRSYIPCVERYSIDEGFADITDISRSMKLDYGAIGKLIKDNIEKSLGITVSIGVSVTKSLAKIGSSYNKPSGLVVIRADDTDIFLKKTDIGAVWGIGWRTAPKLKSFGLHTAYDFVHENEAIIAQKFNKLIVEIWHELRGKQIYQIDTAKKTTYQSITKTHTVTPATTDSNVLLARLLEHIEDAFTKARRYNYQVGRISIFLKTQKFTYETTEIKLTEKTAYPFLIRREIRQAFQKIYRRHTPYRASGCTLSDLQNTAESQPSLFHATNNVEEKLKNLYPLFDNNKIQFGSSLFDNRKTTKREKLSIPKISFDP